MIKSPENLLQVPEEMGVMVLPGVHLFPGSLVPLYIFEDRYRVMLEEALQGPRLFGVGARLELPDEVGGLGIVRACVRNADGTSHLILQGLHRVRFRRWHDRQLYPTALIDLVPSEVLPGDADCLARVMQLCWRLSEIGVVFPESFAQQLRNLDCPSLASDVLAGALVQDNDLRYELLQERKVRRRLSILEKFLLGWLEQGALAEE